MLVHRTHSKSFTLARAAVLAAGLVGAVSCGSESTAPASGVERDGPSVAVGNGTAHAYVLSSALRPSAIGVAFTRTALDGLPATDAMWTLPLPDNADVAPFDHVMVNWNAQGHPPGPYMLPHFDVHFYTISSAAQAAITGGPDTVSVPASFVPRDYVSGVESVPDMGVHWIDTTSAELHGHVFDRTFIYGFSRGSLAFMEPMITRAYLAGDPDASEPIKQPQSFERSGRYPGRYRVYRDATADEVRVELDSLR
jgi:hypothetical protein